jgi:hypothetical protein
VIAHANDTRSWAISPRLVAGSGCPSDNEVGPRRRWSWPAPPFVVYPGVEHGKVLYGRCGHVRVPRDDIPAGGCGGQAEESLGSGYARSPTDRARHAAAGREGRRYRGNRDSRTATSPKRRARVRKYQEGSPAARVDRRAAAPSRRGLRRRHRPRPGFAAYEFMDCGDGEIITLSVFRDADQAETSRELARRWTEENLQDLEFSRGEALRGEIRVSRAARDMLEPCHVGAARKFASVRRYRLRPARSQSSCTSSMRSSPTRSRPWTGSRPITRSTAAAARSSHQPSSRPGDRGGVT